MESRKRKQELTRRRVDRHRKVCRQVNDKKSLDIADLKETIIKAYQSQSLQLTQIHTKLVEVKKLLEDLPKLLAQRDEQATMSQRKRKMELAPMQNMEQFVTLEQKLHDDPTFYEELVHLY
ncbi:uncharacterized protein LOC109860400 isoform X1 [Pseudomyrmex gracilis]|uniref:uncharacterized protein LOC109860400 isoform X1 n=1 Tax=Pseudomyrmex gracilis TaxID=219809 RepID=UPI0009953BB2|nr:uncharacterized protein LOC109860400 isoform X1 [Pseudomyrmex gracilis]